MVAEGELRSNLDESDRVRDLQDKVAELKAEVSFWRIKKNIIKSVNTQKSFINQIINHFLYINY